MEAIKNHLNRREKHQILCHSAKCHLFFGLAIHTVASFSYTYKNTHTRRCGQREKSVRIINIICAYKFFVPSIHPHSHLVLNCAALSTISFCDDPSEGHASTLRSVGHIKFHIYQCPLSPSNRWHFRYIGLHVAWKSFSSDFYQTPGRWEYVWVRAQMRSICHCWRTHIYKCDAVLGSANTPWLISIARFVQFVRTLSMLSISPSKSQGRKDTVTRYFVDESEMVCKQTNT